MHMHARIGIALAIVALTATAAAAQAVKKYGSEAGWDIFIKENMGPGCLVAKKLSAEAQVEMGISATGEKKGYIALYTKKDAAVAAGEKVSVIFDVDGQKFSGEATGQQDRGNGRSVCLGQQSGLYLRSCQEELADDLADRAGSDCTQSQGNRRCLHGAARLPGRAIRSFCPLRMQSDRHPFRHAR